MKKLVLVLVLVLAFALPVLANPFVDVPLNHWAYDSVQSLAAKGVIVGYPDGTFGGGKSLTRYEFAEATAKALAYVEGMDFAAAEDVAILEKLAIEFADELASLGVTVADLEASLGANNAAIAALETTVAKLDTFFEPLTVTGEFRARYNKVVSPMAAATLVDRTRLNFKATINDQTTAGIRLQAEDTISGAATITWSKFFIDHQGDNLQLRVGEVKPATIGLGLIYAFDTYQEEFDGFLATWVWDTENDLGDWTLFGEVEDFYIANIAFTLGDEDEVAVGVTGAYDVLAAGYAGGADLAFALGDEDEVSVAIDGAVFYDTALSYAGATKITGALDDLGLTVKAWYVLPGFIPTNMDFTADRLGGYVEAKYPLTDEVTGKVKYTYEMDSAAVAAVTNKVRGTLNYVPEDAAVDEAGEVYVEYNVIATTTKGRVKYMNYPLADDFVLSGLGQYTFPTADYAGAVTLVYDLDDDMDLTVEGRVDSDGAALWSAEVELAYALATNTKLSVGFEMNTWSDDLKDYDDLTINDTLGTVKAELKVTF
jgi:hypothetical protein